MNAQWGQDLDDCCNNACSAGKPPSTGAGDSGVSAGNGGGATKLTGDACLHATGHDADGKRLGLKGKTFSHTSCSLKSVAFHCNPSN